MLGRDVWRQGRTAWRPQSALKGVGVSLLRDAGRSSGWARRERPTPDPGSRTPGKQGRSTMPVYKAPVDDVLFLLNDVFHIERYANLPGFADASPDIVEAIVREAAKFCEEILAPLNRVGDRQGCQRGDDGSVTTPNGFREAYRRCVEGGWI